MGKIKKGEEDSWDEPASAFSEPKIVSKKFRKKPGPRGGTSHPNDPKYKRKVKMSDGRVLEMTAHQRGSILKDNRGIHNIPKEPMSTEVGEPENVEADEFDSLPYPPPGKGAEFRKIWAAGIDGITSRSNFNVAHLGLYEIYCSLLAELRQLEEFIRQNGMTYRVTTVMGEIRKPYPEISLRDKARAQVASYSRLLDIKPKKDNSLAEDKKNEGEWA